MHVCGILQSTWRTAGSRNLCGIYSRSSAIYIMQQYILQKYTKFRLIHFGSVLNCQYRSIQAQVSIFQHSTIAALYKKRPRGVQRGAALCPFAVFSHSNVKYLCGLPQPIPMHKSLRTHATLVGTTCPYKI